MSPNRHPCIDTSKCKSFGDLSHHPVEERTNTKKRKQKKCQIVILEKSNVIKIKGYVKLVEHQFEEHMEYDGMYEDKLKPNGKHQ
jgi:hypothetical protein